MQKKNNKILPLLIVILLLSAVLVFLVIKLNGVDTGDTNEPDEVETMSGDFDTDLFKASFSASKNKNVVVSPFSVKMALSMAAQGANGKTLEEMNKVIGLDETSNEYFRRLIEDAAKDGDITLNIANSVWLRQGLEFNQEYLDILNQYYMAQASTLDFGNPSSKDTINKWVSEKTNGKIEEIVDKIEPLDIAFLINAIYFNANWSTPFEQGLTSKKDFTLLDGSKVKADLMSKTAHLLYQENNEFQAVELPYGENERYVMRVYLPKEDVKFDKFVKGIDKESLQQWGGDFGSMKGVLELPKFKTEYSNSMKDILISMGIKEAFNSNSADFSKMVTVEGQNVYISEVMHKTYIDVNEKGTEAAAATSIEMSATSAPQPEEMFEMIVDRPFVFTIDDKESGEILFIGAIINPLQ
ncbi:MAG TPA: serpin family protein [Candidatus Dojkabacteria bacterium]|nr:serpin family protein [Candidatus Dojkabacteria bacterium]